jgi:hypothetical protein
MCPVGMLTSLAVVLFEESVFYSWFWRKSIKWERRDTTVAQVNVDGGIKCLHCAALVFKALRVICPGDVISAKDFICVVPSAPNPVEGTQVLCPKCGDTPLVRWEEVITLEDTWLAKIYRMLVKR